MAEHVVETIYGKYRVYRVVRTSGLMGPSFSVRSDDGKVRASFSRLDRAVQWAHEHAHR